jgi:hypothetical protein
MFECLETTLGLETQASKIILHHMLDRAVKMTPQITVIRSLRTQSFEWNEIVKLEAKCVTYFENTDVTKTDTIGQLSFQDDYFRSLNHFPFILIALSLFKIYMVPAMAIFMPILAFILPYVVIRYMYKIPMTLERYFGLLKGLWAGKSDGSWVQKGVFLFSLVQGIIQPVQNAIHYNTTEARNYRYINYR